MGTCVIGIDAGGTMTKAALFDLAGKELACARSRNVTLFPQLGWTERDADAMWNAAAKAISAVLEQSGTDPSDVAAISVAGYGSGLYLLDRDGNPVCPGIVSTDGRAAGLVAELQRDGRADAIAEQVSQYIWPGQGLTLLGWFRRNAPEVLERAHSVAFCKDFLRGRLCGDLSTDYSDAGASGIYDVRRGRWSEEALRILGVGDLHDKLPEIGPSEAVVGKVTPQVAALTGLIAGTPVVRGTVDMAASAMASGVTRPDQMSVVAGTFSIASTLHQDAPKTDAIPMLQFPYPLGGWIAAQGSATSASNLEWVVKTMLQHGGTLDEGRDVYETVNDAVRRVMGQHTNAMFFPYLFGGPEGAPAGLVGMSARTDFDKIMLAVFEGIVFAHKADVDQALTGRHAASPGVIRLTGGASRSPCWSEMFADILGLPVEVPVGSEFGALGTAICAATGAGAFASLKDGVTAMTGILRRHEVNGARGAVSLAKYPRYAALRDAMARAMLADIPAPARMEAAHA
jgi:L-xylulokinase